MSIKTDRVEVRVEEERHQQIRAAAEAVHEKPSEFIRNAAYERADRILALANHTLMPAEQFDEMMRSLDIADDAPALAKAAAKPRAFTRG